MFVQAANTEEGLQVICWSTCYRYKERGRFASMKRGVWRNGKRSSNVKYAEALGKRCPRELSKGVYTDLTSRYTEGQRGRVSNIIEEFSVNNEEETRDRINSTVSYLLDFDSLGVFLCLGPIQWERDDNENLSFATGPNCLQQDYSGGELFVNNSPHNQVSDDGKDVREDTSNRQYYKLGKGDLLIFNNRNSVHGVREVIAGQRITTGFRSL